MSCFSSLHSFVTLINLFALLYFTEFKMKGTGMSTRKTMIFSIFGIAIGLCIGTVFKNYRALELVKRCNLKAMRESMF